MFQPTVAQRFLRAPSTTLPFRPADSPKEKPHEHHSIVTTERTDMKIGMEIAIGNEQHLGTVQQVRKVRTGSIAPIVGKE
jgi:hypothetical protein